MLAEARKSNSGPGILYVQGNAERLPLKDMSVGLVYMSMVYHHLEDQHLSAHECSRVLRSGGYVCLRNSTIELLDSVPYLEYFPAARAISQKRLPPKDALIDTITAHNFELISHDVIKQKFADSLAEYYEKISQRALSDLASISDTDFQVGLRKMAEAIRWEEDSEEIYESIDLFAFRRL